MRFTGLGIHVLILALVQGCASRSRQGQFPPPGPVAHARWDPGFDQARLPLDPDLDWYKGLKQVLIWRSSSDSFWALTQLILHQAPVADAMMVMETLPSDTKEEYTFCVVVRKAGRTYVFESCPLLNFDDRPPLWGAEIDRQKADPIWDLIERDDNYSSSEAFCPEGSEGVASRGWIEMNPWTIHLYRRRGMVADSYIVDNPELDWDVVEGKKALSQVAKAGLPPPPPGVEHSAGAEEYFARTYPARLLITAVERLRFRDD